MNQDFLDQYNCYTANIRSYGWLTTYRNYIKKNSSKIGFNKWTEESSSLLYSDFLIYMTIQPTNISYELMNVLNNSLVINKRKIIFDIAKKSVWKIIDYNNIGDGSIIFGDAENISNSFNPGDVTRINLVELSDEEFESIKQYLMEEFEKFKNKGILAFWATHPLSNKKIIMIIENEIFN